MDYRTGGVKPSRPSSNATGSRVGSPKSLKHVGRKSSLCTRTPAQSSRPYRAKRMQGTPCRDLRSIHRSCSGRMRSCGRAALSSIQPWTPLQTKDKSGMPDEYLSSCLCGRKSSGIRRRKESHTRCSGSLDIIRSSMVQWFPIEKENYNVIKSTKRCTGSGIYPIYRACVSKTSR